MTSLKTAKWAGRTWHYASILGEALVQMNSHFFAVSAPMQWNVSVVFKEYANQDM